MNDCRPRFMTPRTPSRATYGPKVAELAELMGKPLMPWQREVVDTALEYDEQSGRFFYREVRITVPRQSGKTILLLARMVFRCVAMGPNRRVVFTMQDGGAARSKLLYDFLPLLQESPLRDMFTSRRSNGDPHFMWRNGSMMQPLPTTETAGHGMTIDDGVVDEAFDNDGRSEQAMTPAMVTKRDAQFWIVSTMGTTDAEWFNQKVSSGRELAENGVTEGVYYCEYSADPEADPGAEETWRSCMPALGHTTDLATIRSIYASMPLADFKRAFLNIPVDRHASAPWVVIPQHEWTARASREFDIADDSPVYFGLEVPRDRMSACLSLAGWTADGVPQVEVVDPRGGTAWVVDRIKGIKVRFPGFGGVVIDKGAPAATFIDQLEAEGVEVISVSGDDHARFAQQFFDAVRDGRVWHRGQPVLDAAVAGAVRRNLGDRWLWSRRDSSVDISPLVSCTLALGVLESKPTAEPPKPVFAY